MTEHAATPSLWDAARRAEIRQIVTRWCTDADPPDLPEWATTLPASPDDVFWLLDVIEVMRGLLVEADSAISHLHHRKTWPLDAFETDRLIGRLRKASE